MQFQPSTHSYGQWPPAEDQSSMTVGAWSPNEEVEEPKVNPVLQGVWVAYSITSLVTTPFAMAISYKRNKSLGWALLSGLVSVPYMVYTQIIDKESK